MVFSKEEVHVVELDRISAVAGHQVIKNFGCPLRRLHALCSSIGGMHSAETAVERTADTGVMHRRALPEERGPQVLLHRQTMKRRPGKFVRTFHWPFSVGAMKPERVLIAEAED